MPRGHIPQPRLRMWAYGVRGVFDEYGELAAVLKASWQGKEATIQVPLVFYMGLFYF